MPSYQQNKKSLFVYREKNKDELRKKRKLYQQNNREVIRAGNLRYYYNHKSDFTANTAKRRAAQLQATPLWADLMGVKDLFKQCELLFKETGVRYHVDHIYPIQGETVSGLHTMGNLRIITADENLAKNNKHPEEWEKEKANKGLIFSTTPVLLE